MKVKVAQLCPTLCEPMDCTVHGIFQVRILEWVAFFSSPGDLPNPGIKPRSPALQVDSLPDEPQGKLTRGLKASILWHSAFFMIQLSHLYITSGKNIALTTWTLVGKVISGTMAKI